jgi:hypothetical protein
MGLQSCCPSPRASLLFPPPILLHTLHFTSRAVPCSREKGLRRLSLSRRWLVRIEIPTVVFSPVILDDSRGSTLKQASVTSSISHCNTSCYIYRKIRRSIIGAASRSQNEPADVHTPQYKFKRLKLGGSHVYDRSSVLDYGGRLNYY